MADEFKLETERLVLRDWQETDARLFFQSTNTPAVMRWLDGVMDEAKQQAMLGRIASCSAENGFCFWIVERKHDGTILGFCGLKRADAPGSTVPGEIEAGWRLREDVWGQGYAKEAAIATLDVAFERFGADRVVALTVPGNTASWGLMERLGMTRRMDLDYVDPRFAEPLNPAIVYSIDKAAGEPR